MLLIFALFLIYKLDATPETLNIKHRALHFGPTTEDFIRFSYDTTPLQDALSICTWIKRVYTSSALPVIFDFFSGDEHEILIGSDGRYNRIVGDHVLDNQNRKFVSKPAGRWFSYCLTWSASSRDLQLYIDGEMVAAARTSPGRKLRSSGVVRFNRLDNSDSSAFVFGGQLFQFNIYSGVLSSDAIRKMAEGGLCFDLELEKFSRNRILHWEEIVLKPKNGTVIETFGCHLEGGKKMAASQPSRNIEDL